MKITVESTEQIVHINGVEARMWEGKTDSGIPVIVWIPRIAVRNTEDTTQFEAELRECRAPSAEAQSFPLRMVL